MIKMKGIGEERGKLLASLGIETIEALATMSDDQVRVATKPSRNFHYNRLFTQTMLRRFREEARKLIEECHLR